MKNSFCLLLLTDKFFEEFTIEGKIFFFSMLESLLLFQKTLALLLKEKLYLNMILISIFPYLNIR